MSTLDDCKKPFHKHLMVRGHGVTPPRETHEAITWLAGLVQFLGMKILQGPFSSYVDEPGNEGITAVVMIETSHIAFHVWDAEDPSLVQFDVYTCGSLDVPSVMDRVIGFFGLRTYEYLVYDRENGFELIESTKVG
jgi:S-adenosylmethionine/arginine decarboxylase-like enzyme